MDSTSTSRHSAKKAFSVAIAFFFLAALAGLLMRLMFIQEIPFLEYKHILHAHSHLAMLGWGFTALAGALVFIFLPELVKKHVYRKAFLGNLLAGIGMFFAFLYQGYGPVSIGFCTLHLIVTYYFSWHFLRDIKSMSSSISIKFAKWAIYWMLVSTIGLWAIAPVSIILGKLHPLYYASIQFFLHMQFNGWFTFGILALLFKLSEDFQQPTLLQRGTFTLLQISLLLTYTLSVTWSTPANILFYLNSIGVVLQVVAFIFIAKAIYHSARSSFSNIKISGWLLRIGLLSLAAKVLIQGAVALPFIAKVSYTIRNFVIGFIHLSMLGAFSLSLIAILLHKGLLPKSNLSKVGYRSLAIGFILMEAVLFIQGILLWLGAGFIPAYYHIIFLATLILPAALAILLYAFFNKGEQLNYQYFKVK